MANRLEIYGEQVRNLWQTGWKFMANRLEISRKQYINFRQTASRFLTNYIPAQIPFGKGTFHARQ